MSHLILINRCNKIQKIRAQKLTSPDRTLILEWRTVETAKRGFKPLKGVEERGGDGKELHTNIATRGFMSRRKSSINRFRPGLRPRPRWGSLRRSPRPPSRLGRGIPPPHSPPLSTPSASRFSAPSALRSRRPCYSHLIFRCAANGRTALSVVSRSVRGG